VLCVGDCQAGGIESLRCAELRAAELRAVKIRVPEISSAAFRVIVLSIVFMPLSLRTQQFRRYRATG
jgi:hypothetical protein